MLLKYIRGVYYTVNAVLFNNAENSNELYNYGDKLMHGYGA
jgi:hypothetical protein